MAASRATAEVRNGSGDDHSLVLPAFEIYSVPSVEGLGPGAQGGVGRSGKPGNGCLGPNREVLRQFEIRVSDSDHVARMATTGRRAAARQPAEKPDHGRS